MTTDFREEIEAAYLHSGNALGWRFLYSPAETLEGAKVAFIGLNPGGSTEDEAHGTYCMAKGSAYADESWSGCAPGHSKLQAQVLALFRMLEVAPEQVLAGNLVPFRSRDWQSLRNPKASLRFGKKLCAEVLRSAQPSLVVTMGLPVTKSVSDILGIRQLEKQACGWGRVSAYCGAFEGGKLVGLPHLSRFGVATRPESAECLEKLFT